MIFISGIVFFNFQLFNFFLLSHCYPCSWYKSLNIDSRYSKNWLNCRANGSEFDGVFRTEIHLVFQKLSVWNPIGPILFFHVYIGVISEAIGEWNSFEKDISRHNRSVEFRSGVFIMWKTAFSPLFAIPGFEAKSSATRCICTADGVWRPSPRLFRAY